MTKKTSKQIDELAQRQHFRKRKEVYKRISQAVRWNGHCFESMSALARFLGYSTSGAIGAYVKRGKPVKGHIVEKITRDDYERYIQKK